MTLRTTISEINRTIKLFGTDKNIAPIGTIDSIYKRKLKTIGIDITLDEKDLARSQKLYPDERQQDHWKTL